MKRLVITCLELLTICSTISFSQVKYTSDGYFGIGTTSPRDIFHLYQTSPDLYFQCSTNDQTKLRFVESSTNYTGAYMIYDANPNTLIFGIHPASTSSTSDDDNILTISGTDGYMRFYPQSTAPYSSSLITYALNDYTKCYGVTRNTTQNFYVYGDGQVNYKSLYQMSDISLKENIVAIPNSLELLIQLRPVQYTYKAGAFGSEFASQELEFGLIAQEVEDIMPEIVHERDDGLKAINYVALIPFLIDAVKSQQTEIIDLNAKLAELSGTVKKSASVDQLNNPLNELSQSSLAQNVPNPFDEITIIKYIIPKTMSYAVVNVYDLQGSLMKSYEVDQSGSGEVIIPASEFNPGLYIYNLIVDGIEVASRRMILTD